MSEQIFELFLSTLIISLRTKNLCNTYALGKSYNYSLTLTLGASVHGIGFTNNHIRYIWMFYISDHVLYLQVYLDIHNIYPGPELQI